MFLQYQTFSLTSAYSSLKLHRVFLTTSPSQKTQQEGGVGLAHLRTMLTKCVTA